MEGGGVGVGGGTPSQLRQMASCSWRLKGLPDEKGLIKTLALGGAREQGEARFSAEGRLTPCDTSTPCVDCGELAGDPRLAC